MTWHLLFKIVIFRYPRHQWHQCTFKNVFHMTTCARLSKHVSFEKEMHCIIWNVWLWTCDKYLYLRKCLKNIIFFSRPMKFELILLQVLWRYNSYFISRLKENMEKICFYIFCRFFKRKIFQVFYIFPAYFSFFEYIWRAKRAKIILTFFCYLGNFLTLKKMFEQILEITCQKKI